MANRLTLRGDLDEYVAREFLAPRVRAVTSDVADALRRHAPDARMWLTVRDERVRPAHAAADTQTIPANLRFILDRADGRPGREQARFPGDPALHISNRANCRCAAVPVTGDIARNVRAEPVEVLGTRVTSAASVRYHRVVESEFPSYPDSGGGWAARAADTVAAASRAASARRT